MKFKLLCVTIISIISFLSKKSDSAFSDLSRQKTLRIFQLKGKCDEYKNAPVYWKDVQWNQINRIFYISAKIVVTKNLANGLKLQVELNRCQARGALDSCEKYQTIRIPRLCNLLHSENTPWTPFVKLMKPPISCPIKKGVYAVNNGTFDGGAFTNWPLGDYYWGCSIKVFNDVTDEMTMCMYFETQAAPV